MTDAEKLAKIKEMISKGYVEEFNWDQEYWSWGNFDDAYQYGMDCGEQSVLGEINNILKDAP